MKDARLASNSSSPCRDTDTSDSEAFQCSQYTSNRKGTCASGSGEKNVALQSVHRLFRPLSVAEAAALGNLQSALVPLADILEEEIIAGRAQDAGAGTSLVLKPTAQLSSLFLKRRAKFSS